MPVPWGHLPTELPTAFLACRCGELAHQIALMILTVIAFLLEVVPLEIQRRVVNDLVKEDPLQSS